jgi:hypothetical protein
MTTSLIIVLHATCGTASIKRSNTMRSKTTQLLIQSPISFDHRSSKKLVGTVSYCSSSLPLNVITPTSVRTDLP